MLVCFVKRELFGSLFGKYVRFLSVELWKTCEIRTENRRKKVLLFSKKWFKLKSVDKGTTNKNKMKIQTVKGKKIELDYEVIRLSKKHKG